VQRYASDGTMEALQKIVRAIRPSLSSTTSCHTAGGINMRL
jgi:hypothetical protein